MMLLQLVKGKFEGVLSPTINARLAELRLNATYVDADSIGRVYKDGSVTPGSCLDKVQRGDADFSLAHSTAPVLARNLLQGPTTGYERMSIISAFNASDGQVDHRNVLSSMNNFDPSLWMLTLTFAWILALALTLTFSIHISLMVRSRCPGRRWLIWRMCWMSAKDFVWAVCCHNYSGFQPQFIDHSVRLVALSTVLFSYLIYLYLGNLFQTDLTILMPPQIIKSYVDIITRGLMPWWFKPLSDEQHFIEAAKGTVEHDVWQHAMRLSSGDQGKAVVGLKNFSFTNSLLFFGQRSALITSQTTLPAAHRHACFLETAAAGPDSRIHVSSDEAGMEMLRVYAFSGNISLSLKAYLTQVMTALFESDSYRKDAQLSMIAGQAAGSRQTESLINECLTNSIPDIVVATGNPDLSYFAVLFATMAALFIVAGCVLLLECVISARSKKRRRVAPLKSIAVTR